MSLDPIHYDVAELRELARVRGDRYVVDGFLWTEPPDSLPPTDEVAHPNRPATWTGSLEERQKPYLRRLPTDPTSRVLVREWVQRLMDRAGFDGTVAALDYYESMGWLTEGVREDMEDYLLATGYRADGSFDDLSRPDHVESLALTVELARRAGADDEDGRDAE